MIKKRLAKVAGAFDLRDFHAYAGIAMLSAGFYFVYQPAALIVPGFLLFWLAVRR